MNFAFHYCCIRVLAEKAGFAPEDAQRIAYASQHVDDATEHRPVRVDGLPNLDGLRLDEQGWLEPVCTANFSPRQLVAPSLDMQRKTYIPFHFIPGNPGADWLTVADSEMVEKLLEIAVDQHGHAVIQPDRRRALVKLGIALHTYADSFAHAGFSGRNCQPENDLAEIEEWKKADGWQPIHHRYGKISDAFSFIGHVQAGLVPDQPWRIWRYRYAASGETEERNNPDDFCVAAQKIFIHLCRATGRAFRQDEWQLLENKLFMLFSHRPKCPNLFPRCRAHRLWRRFFTDIDLRYNRHAWRSKAVHNGAFFGGSDWLWFHAEAQAQRDWVLSQINFNLM